MALCLEPVGSHGWLSALLELTAETGQSKIAQTNTQTQHILQRGEMIEFFLLGIVVS